MVDHSTYAHLASCHAQDTQAVVALFDPETGEHSAMLCIPVINPHETAVIRIENTYPLDLPVGEAHLVCIAV